jgi:hypothetical protein
VTEHHELLAPNSNLAPHRALGAPVCNAALLQNPLRHPRAIECGPYDLHAKVAPHMQYHGRASHCMRRAGQALHNSRYLALRTALAAFLTASSAFNKNGLPGMKPGDSVVKAPQPKKADLLGTLHSCTARVKTWRYSRQRILKMIDTLGKLHRCAAALQTVVALTSLWQSILLISSNQ